LGVRRVLGLLSLILIVGGVGVALSRPATFGLFASAPASATLTPVMMGGGAMSPFSDVVALGPPQLVGYGVALVGLLTLTGIVGFALGRGRRSAIRTTAPRG
ncbi:MAG TPA: hypothetical protein VMV41_09185, partial [Cellulomonadaceae bacterium]|nr:hypothetical protein [Cellulomonadaceae bacterium]